MKVIFDKNYRNFTLSPLIQVYIILYTDFLVKFDYLKIIPHKTTKYTQHLDVYFFRQ